MNILIKNNKSKEMTIKLINSKLLMDLKILKNI